eukprot:TRINITY_DN4838_c0_g1_i1.p1 TRINITY_DN4838_c0_g1~~TRINITY_DN4838_c0_g1_i1.p1  ORF type:complete len:762 (+),score=166.73 TRINITY_DN4838_c0_g1_i1:103-2388(+)
MSFVSNKEVSSADRKYAASLTDGEDSLFFVRWICKRKKTKLQDRLLILGQYRIYSVKQTLTGRKQIRREGHYYDLLKIISHSNNELLLKFKSFEIHIMGEDTVDEIVNMIRSLTRTIFYGFPAQSMPQYDVPLERIKPWEPLEPSEFEGVVDIYKAYCNYYATPVNPAFMQFIENLTFGKDEPRDLPLDQCSGIDGENELSLNLRPVMSALRYNTFFTGIVLRKVSRKDVIMVLSNAMRFNTTIEKIILSDVDASEGCVELGQALRANHNSSLAHIDLSNNAIKDKGLIGLSLGLESLQSDKEEKALKLINIENCVVQAKGFVHFMKTLTGHPDLSAGLVELNISHNFVSTAGTTALSAWISAVKASGKKSHLRKLFAADCSLDVFVLTQAIRSCLLDTLEVLDISMNKIDKAASQSLVFILENSPCLSSLVLADCSITPEIAFVLISSISLNGKLKHLELDLSRNQLGLEGAQQISKVLSSARIIHTLKLKSNDFNRDAMICLLRSLIENKTLRGIDLSYNLKTSPKNGEVFAVLNELLVKTKTLQTLIIAGNERTHLGKDFAAVLPGLAKNTSIIALDITGNKIGDKCAMDLCEALNQNRTLTHLVWDRNNVDIVGWQALVHTLKTNKTLMKIPTPFHDLDKAINDAKDKKRFREKYSDVMNQIQGSLASNRGDPKPAPFLWESENDNRLTLRPGRTSEDDLGEQRKFSALSKSMSDADIASLTITPSASSSLFEEAVPTVKESFGSEEDAPPPIPDAY